MPIFQHAGRKQLEKEGLFWFFLEEKDSKAKKWNKKASHSLLDNFFAGAKGVNRMIQRRHISMDWAV